MFSLPLPSDVSPACQWGARAIFGRGKFELLSDRQEATNEVPHSMLLHWLNTKGLKELTKLCKDLDGSSNETVRFDDGIFGIAASPRSSYGYLYITSWRINPRPDIQYELLTCPTDCKWSGKQPPPAIGDRVHVNFNEFGNGTVIDYLTEHGYLGVRILLDKPPTWFKKQHPQKEWMMAFGAEIGPEVPKKKKVKTT